MKPYGIEKELIRLAEKAMSGRITCSDPTGHTFTISNLGRRGVTYFTPLINPPAISILSVGTIQKTINSEIEYLSLVFDHRAVDGVPAARFLNELRRE